ncbi:beta-lactamase family protein [bacterium]|nr:beta-lactamase family protein [bacterium]
MKQHRQSISRLFFFIVMAIAIVQFYNRITGQMPIEKELARLVKTYVEGSGFSGVIMVVSESDTLLYRGYGKADYEADIPNTLETQFPVGDLTQLITRGVAALMADNGLIDPDSSITTVAGHTLPQPVTLRQLLQHRSGLSDAYTKDILLALPGRQREPIDRDMLLRRLIKYPPDTLAGIVKNYNRTGYALAAAVMNERLQGHWRDWIDSNLFKPLNMTGAGFNYSSVAAGYRLNGEEWVLSDSLYLSHYPGTCDIVCTAGDMFKWIKILSDPLFKNDDNRSLLGKMDHSGRLPGYCSVIMHMPLQQLTIVILSNFENANVEDLSTHLATLVLRRRIIKELYLPEKWYSWRGIYESHPFEDDSMRLIIHGDEQHLKMTLPGDKSILTVELHPESEMRYIAELYGLMLNIVVDFSHSGKCRLNISGWNVEATRIAALPDSL